MKIHLLLLSLVSCTLSQAQTIDVSFRASETADNIYYSCGFDSDAEMDSWQWQGIAPVSFSWKMWAGAYISPINDHFSDHNPNTVKSLLILQSKNAQNETGVSPQVTVLPGSSLSFWMCSGIAAQGVGASLLNNYDFRVCLIDAQTQDTTTLMSGREWIQQNPDYNRYHWKNLTFDIDQFAGRTVSVMVQYVSPANVTGDHLFIDDIQLLQLSKDMTAQVNQGQQVHFINLSTVKDLGGTTRFQWEFPGGQPATSNEETPVVTYLKEGIYDVRLTVSNVSNTDSVGATLLREGYVQVSVATPEAAFTVPDSIYRRLGGGYLVATNRPLTLLDRSANYPTEWLWTFGQGASIDQSTEPQAEITYSKPGTYDFTLTASNKAGTSTVSSEGCSIQVGGQATYVWNIDKDETAAMARLLVGSGEGFYGGSNTRRMWRWAEHFSKPQTEATIQKVGILFLSTNSYKPDTTLTVSIQAPDAKGLPGTVLATTTMALKNAKATSRADSLHTLQLEDELTEFVFSQPVSISTDFFVTISGIPNYEMNPKTHAINSVYMASVLRPEGERNTTYVYCDSLAFVNNQAYFTNNFRWIENTSAPVSFAMAPCLTLADGQPVSVAAIISSGNDADTRYYRTDGRQLTAAPRQGIYLVRRPDGSTTKRIAK